MKEITRKGLNVFIVSIILSILCISTSALNAQEDKGTKKNKGCPE